MTKLFQMDDGSWIDPLCVRGIEARDSDDVEGTQTSPRVMVDFLNDRRTYECESFGKATQLRDALALLVNRTEEN